MQSKYSAYSKLNHHKRRFTPPENTKTTDSKCAEVEYGAEKGMEGFIYRNIQNTACQQDRLFIPLLVGKKQIMQPCSMGEP